MAAQRWLQLAWIWVTWSCMRAGDWRRAVQALDPSLYLQWEVSFVTVAPLGVQQQVIGINGQFPGPVIKSTTNDNLLPAQRSKCRNGIQQRRTSWQDGVTGTNCAIPPKWNWTYNFQVKDQIGSYFYFPSLGLQRAGGGYGGFTITNRVVISAPFGLPDGDITILIGDWYNAGHKALRESIQQGQLSEIPDGVEFYLDFYELHWKSFDCGSDYCLQDCAVAAFDFDIGIFYSVSVEHNAFSCVLLGHIQSNASVFVLEL
ncbi:hypothetical protein L7F22_037824 [Adiantum nelumboides]|nr:hypothetical protein [Adiantum nelumboides]